MKVRAFIFIIVHIIASSLFQTNPVQALHTPQRIQTFITQIKEQLEKDAESFPELIQEVETYTQSCTDSVDMAILHSMIAEMYDYYFDQNAHKIYRRTELTDYRPSDIREWTANLFKEKIKHEFTLSLQPAHLLQQTPINRYNLILEKGKDTPLLRPTVYDFLVYRAIDINPSIQWYDDLLTFRRSQPEKQPLLFDELAYWKYSYHQGDIPTTAYQHKLDSLYNAYQAEPYAAEIRIDQLYLLRDQQHQGSQAKQDSVRAALYSLCKESIAQYPQYNRIHAFQNQLNEMENPFLNIEIKNNVYPGKEQIFRIHYKNIPQLTVRIYQSLRNPEDTWKNKKNSPYLRGKLIKEKSYTLSLPNTYTHIDTLLIVPMEQLGLYEYEVTTPDKKLSVSSCFSVSRLALITRNLNQTTECFVTDIESGKPIEGATVISYKTNMMNGSLEPQEQKQTDRFGLVSFTATNKQTLVRPIFREDTASIITNSYDFNKSKLKDKEKAEIALFTDRGIYRPGQTIYFKGIAYIENSDTPHVVDGQTYTVSLLDANYKTIAQKSYQTNSFGSFDGEFAIPSQVLSGTFLLETGEKRISIRVEEYKRPSFKIDILPITEQVSFGQTLHIKGKAEMFSGMALQTGKINWSITPAYFWGEDYYPFIPRYQNTQSATGSADVDHKGNFTIPFTPQLPQCNPNHPVFFSYRVKVTLTDSKGETQETDYLFSVGNRGFLLNLQQPSSIMDKEVARARINAKTVNGEKITIEGIYNLYSLLEEQENTENPQKSTYKIKQLLTTGTFISNKELSPAIFNSLLPGRYRLEVKASDAQGRTITNYKDFILYTQEDKRPPVFMHTWVVQQQTTCSPGEEAKFIFGTSDKETYVLYERFSSDQKRLDCKLLQLNNENRSFRIPFKESDGEGFTVSFTFIKKGELYTEEIPIYRCRPNLRLNIYTETFRNHLLPGSQEYWKFRITDTDSIAATSEVLASMYDASLDKLKPFRWYFRTQKGYSWFLQNFYAGSSFKKSTKTERKTFKLLPVYEFQYDHLNWQNALNPIYKRNFFSLSMNRGIMAKENIVLEEAAVTSTAYDAQPIQEEVVEIDNEHASTTLLLRENFAETAFFYPALITNEKGEVAFGFTIPGSNTTWKLQMFAHTKGLKHGYLSKEVITCKPLMITPNLPRFLRQGDKATIIAQVSNQSQEAIQGEALLEFFDPNTDQLVESIVIKPQEFKLATDSTISVSWSFLVPPVPHGMIGCRIIAKGDKGSDGEQHLIPVLSNQIMLTESTPFYLFNKDQEIVHLQTEKGIQPFRTTLELTANPIWYAVQALPTINQPENENIISWFGSYYGNTLAYHIASSHPRIQQAIRQWEAKGEDVSTLYSNLEKNPELKTILLQETPWVLEAENETDQKQRLYLLLNQNRSKEQQQRAMRHLLEQQTEQGGWGWFKGWYPNTTFTLYILKGMSQLTDLQAIEYNQQEKEMQIKAIRYLDKQIQQKYELLQQDKNRKRYIFSPEIIEYLYVRSAYRDIPEPGESKEAIRYFTNLAKEQWEKQSLYGKGAIAWIMLRNGEKEVAHQILSWLRKTATHSADKGMFWANNRRETNFFLSPIDTHCLFMSLFKELSTNQEEINEMKQWLLNQKQTQAWESVPTTCQAIYTLLLTGNDWLTTSNECSVRWDNQAYHTNEGEVLTGYLKIVHDQTKNEPPSNNQISITKKGNAPAWGAVYLQYLQNINQVKADKGVLNVEKKLFIERNIGRKKQLLPITQQEPLQIGDKVIIRLTIRTDRDMEYVVLKDMRAGCFEPADQQSGTTFRDGLWYYQSPTDISENFFFDRLPTGTYVLEYPVYVSRAGEYASGISTIQCLYAPEFVSHTKGEDIRIY